MLVITADQRGSRTHDDLVPTALADVERLAAGRLAIAADRNAGDEVQSATDDAAAALSIVLHLVRTGTWSVGIGVGGVDGALPPEIRAARGAAFLHARDAVERAKTSPGRLAIEGDDAPQARDVESMLRLLVELRDRRTGPGWQVADLLATGLSQKQIAEHLHISETAVSLRAKAAGLRTEEASIPALVRMLDRLNRSARPVTD